MAGQPGNAPGARSFRAIAPYLVGLAVAAALYAYADRIDFTARPGTLGPDFWPKLAIGLLAASCLWEIVRRLVKPDGEARGLSDVLEEAEPEEPSATYPLLLFGGIALTLAYAVLVTVLGFLTASFLFLVVFMYLGRYRNHVVVWSVATAITLIGAVVFMRFAYVSLPRGMPPFDRVTDFVRVMLGG